MNSSFSFHHPGAIHPITPIVQCKTASAARNWIHYVPQKTATTTFAFSSVFILLHALLAGGQSIRPPAHWNAECREWCSHTDNQLRDKTLLRIFLPPPPPLPRVGCGLRPSHSLTHKPSQWVFHPATNLYRSYEFSAFFRLDFNEDCWAFLALSRKGKVIIL